MQTIPVVNNPRRRGRRRRQLTPAQIAAGFGGKSRMSGPRKRHSVKRRRRNPVLAAATLGNPRRRRSGRRRGYTAMRHYRRHYRNPAFLGGLGFDLPMVGWITGGVIASRLVPSLIRKFVWSGMPATGWTYRGVQAATVLGVGYLTRMFTKSAARQQQVVAGGLAAVLYGIYMEEIVPRVSFLAGAEYASDEEISRLTGYEPRLRGYEQVAPNGGLNVAYMS
jgi:hypothetical protein